MLTLQFWQREILQAFLQWRAPIAAGVVLAAAWLLGRLMRAFRLQEAAGGLALGVGWTLALGGLALVPHTPAERLPLLAVAALAIGLAAEFSRPVAALGGGVLAVAGGWWLAGAPRSDAAAGLVLPAMALLALAVLLALRLLRAPRNPWSALAGALALWGALAVVPTPPLWTGLALVAAVAAVGQPWMRREAAAVRLPMAVALAGLAGLAVLALGRFGRGGVSRVDLAVLAPVLAIWGAQRLLMRLPWAGGLAAALAAAALAVLVAGAAGRLFLPG